MTRLATTPAILGILIGGVLAAGLAAGCGSNQVAIGSQNIDAQATGLDATVGRDAPAGGNGGSATGGAAGGVVGTGGVVLTGGTVRAGGATPNGGTTVVGSGGSGGAGGSKASGGTTASGGSKASGGAVGTGGATGTGGSGSGGTTTTCALVGESCVTSSCCGPLICLNWTGSSTCFESIPPPADSGTGQGGTSGAGGGAGGTGGAPNTGGAAASGGATRTGGVAGTGGADGGTGKTCGGLAGVTCPTGEFCEMPTGSCNVADATGTCVAKGTSSNCPAFIVAPEPACGCDGITYYDDCYRQSAGVLKAYDGACVVSCGGVSCPTGQFFCELPAGSCNAADATGTCVLKNVGSCGDGPACGCDGKSYPTDCHRQESGVSKKSDGACFTPTLPAACLTDADCCVAMDQCMAKAYLVGRIEYEAMAASLLNVDSMEWCPPCAQPMVQVQCRGGFCAGEKIPVVSGYYPSMLMSSHCGYISVSDAGAPTSSAHAAVDAGTGADAGPSIWSCSSH